MLKYHLTQVAATNIYESQTKTDLSMLQLKNPISNNEIDAHLERMNWYQEFQNG